MSSTVHHATRATSARGLERPSRRQIGAGLLLGVGFGGLVDGIVLHQILQWHHMLTSTGDHPADTVAGLETNTVADGLFHAATWIVLVLGVVVLRRAWADGETGPSLRALVGTMLAGWGLFNLVEGVVDHHVLGVHDVRDDVAQPLWWNVGFLVFGAALVLTGWLLARRSTGLPVGGGPREPPPTDPGGAPPSAEPSARVSRSAPRPGPPRRGPGGTR